MFYSFCCLSFNFLFCVLCRCTAVLACVIAVPNNHIILMYSPKYGCPILLALYGYYGQPDYSFITLIFILYSTLNYCAAIENSCQNWNFKILHKQSEKNPLVRHFGKSQSKFPKSFQSPWEKKRFKETSSSLAGNNRHPGQLQYYLVKNIARWCILYSAKKSPKILIFSTFIRNENLQNFEEKNHALVHGTLE